jgi:hypothetical protein
MIYMTQVIECASELGHKKIIATERSGLSAAKLSDVQIGIINFLLMRSLRYVANAA